MLHACMTGAHCIEPKVGTRQSCHCLGEVVNHVTDEIATDRLVIRYTDCSSKSSLLA
jgi:hypothetical protein